MKSINKTFAFTSIAITLTVLYAFTYQSIEPWTKEQLIEPKKLAEIINDSSAVKPIIYSIGPGASIKGSIDIGATQEKAKLDFFKSTLLKVKTTKSIVIYCGCCPFNHCPNIRPAFQLLNELKFTNHRLLNLPNNLKTDWIDKGFPVNE